MSKWSRSQFFGCKNVTNSSFTLSETLNWLGNFWDLWDSFNLNFDFWPPQAGSFSILLTLSCSPQQENNITLSTCRFYFKLNMIARSLLFLIFFIRYVNRSSPPLLFQTPCNLISTGGRGRQAETQNRHTHTCKCSYTHACAAVLSVDSAHNEDWKGSRNQILNLKPNFLLYMWVTGGCRM